MPWPGWSVADDPGMMESLLHTDRVSVKDKTKCYGLTFGTWWHQPTNFCFAHTWQILFLSHSIKTECSHHIVYLCGWRCPPSPWMTWNEQYRAWSRALGPPVQESGLWSWQGTSLACHDNAPAPPPSVPAAPSARCCCWPWSRVSPQSAHSHQRAEGEKIITNIWFSCEICHRNKRPWCSLLVMKHVELTALF